MPTFTPTERHRIILDIAHWKTELEHTGGREFTDDDLKMYIDQLRALSDDDLESWWVSTVGEWVASRGDLDIPDDKSFDDWIDQQFDNLIAGDDVEWGYVVTVDLPAPAET